MHGLIKGVLGASVFAFCASEALYRLMLTDYRGKKDLPRNPPDSEHLAQNRQNPALLLSDTEWYDAMQPTDTVICNRSGERIHAYILKNAVPSHKWAVMLHGYSDRPHQTSKFGRRYYADGFNLLSPHERGHDKSEHKAITMGWLDRLDVLDWIRYILCFDPQAQIVLHGISMGAACVMNVTGEALPDAVKCCIEDCGYTSCTDEFNEQIKQYLKMDAPWLLRPAELLTKWHAGWLFSDCSPIKQVRKSKTPTLFIHGSADTFVPFRMRDELFDAARCPKERLTIDGAQHANARETNPALYDSTCKAFVDRYIE